MLDTFRLTLVDPGADLVAAWRDQFLDCERVSAVQGRFEELEAYDCLVSPANSFGLMDGGVDAAITDYFGQQLMDRVQAQILERYLGEQPVGTCMLVETGHAEHKWLAHAPTMRVPMDIRGTDNVYYAMLAVMRTVVLANRDGAAIQHVACPGLGTGYGRMGAEETARQMRAAYDVLLRVPARLTWSVAAAKQRLVDVVPAQITAGGLDVHLRAWRTWDEAAFELARAIGMAPSRGDVARGVAHDRDEVELP